MDAANDWGGGFVQGFTVTNKGESAVSGWTVQMNFGQEVSIGNFWGVNLGSSSGSLLSGSNVGYNGNLQPGASASFGMQGAPGGLTDVTCSAQ